AFPPLTSLAATSRCWPSPTSPGWTRTSAAIPAWTSTIWAMSPLASLTASRSAFGRLVADPVQELGVAARDGPDHDAGTVIAVQRLDALGHPVGQGGACLQQHRHLPVVMHLPLPAVMGGDTRQHIGAGDEVFIQEG